VCSVDGRIKWHVESDAFRGRPVKGRRLDERTRAAALLADGAPEDAPVEARELPAQAWGALERTRTPIVEESLRIAGTNTVLTWLSHSPV
jgi:hypothetical protein